MKIVFYKWKLDEESERLITRIITALKTMLESPEKLETSVIDVASYGETKHEDGWGLAFGKATKYVSGDNIKQLPPAENLQRPQKGENEDRILVLNILRNIAEQTDEPKLSKGTSTEAIGTVTQEGISVGNTEDADIIIPEDTIKYLKKVKDFLSGGEIEIVKGDLRLVIKE